LRLLLPPNHGGVIDEVNVGGVEARVAGKQGILDLLLLSDRRLAIDSINFCGGTITNSTHAVPREMTSCSSGSSVI
jgi:hypothetical protein